MGAHDHFLGSFEQLCINTANEQLQAFFVSHIFKVSLIELYRWFTGDRFLLDQLELMEYSKEGIKGASLTYTDNQAQVDLLLTKPLGLLLIIDEQSRLVTSTPATMQVGCMLRISGHH